MLLFAHLCSAFSQNNTNALPQLSHCLGNTHLAAHVGSSKEAFSPRGSTTVQHPLTRLWVQHGDHQPSCLILHLAVNLIYESLHLTQIDN